ncbi:hypothetical protein [Meridianimarinicoccus roseus]|uniref:hypothetical protein n=1 Tax=Meridianimarinicoccus roseus TaxID=2072018 RepID=UPI0011B22AA7|nr:hypothetical protein [Meridianimarinicoccus roseus]
MFFYLFFNAFDAKVDHASAVVVQTLEFEGAELCHTTSREAGLLDLFGVGLRRFRLVVRHDCHDFVLRSPTLSEDVSSAFPDPMLRKPFWQLSSIDPLLNSISQSLRGGKCLAGFGQDESLSILVHGKFRKELGQCWHHHKSGTLFRGLKLDRHSACDLDKVTFPPVSGPLRTGTFHL